MPAIFFSKSRDRHAKVRGVRVRIVGPSRAQELLVPYDASRSGRERREEPQLAAGQGGRGAAPLDATPVGIKKKVARRNAGIFASIGTVPASTQKRPNPEFQFRKRKGFDKVVVGSRREGSPLVVEKIARRQDDHRHVGRFAQTRERFVPVHFGHHQVEKHEIGLHGERMEKFERGFAVAGFAHGKACGPEMLGDKLANSRFVVGDEDEGSGHKPREPPSL